MSDTLTGFLVILGALALSALLTYLWWPGADEDDDMRRHVNREKR